MCYVTIHEFITFTGAMHRQLAGFADTGRYGTEAVRTLAGNVRAAVGMHVFFFFFSLSLSLPLSLFAQALGCTFCSQRSILADSGGGAAGL